MNRAGFYMAPVLISTLFALMLGCGDKTIPSNWSDNIKIDGHPDDWSELRQTYLEEEGASIGLANDADRIYLMARIKDLNELRSLNLTGLKLWLGPKGRAKDYMMLNLHARMVPPEFLGRMDSLRQRVNKERAQPQMPNRERRRPDSQLICTIKDEIYEVEIALDGANGPAAAWGFDKGFLTLEFSIPLSESRVRYYGLGISDKRQLVVTAEWGDFDIQERRGDMKMQGGGTMPGMPPGAGGDRGGFGDRPPRGGQRGGKHQGIEKPEKREFKIKTELANSE